MFPKGSYQEVPGMGHMIPMEAPERTVSLIRSFFHFNEVS